MFPLRATVAVAAPILLALLPCARAQVTLGHPFGTTKGTRPHKHVDADELPVPVTQAALIGSDTCSTPAAIAGNGVFPFDNTTATTGTQGQANMACLIGGQIGIGKDLWFEWTAPVTGLATITLCTQTAVDTKLAVYAGSGCPSGAPLDCDDDSCSLQSRVTFACTNQGVYTLQLGSYPGSIGGNGTFTISTQTPPAHDACASPVVLAGPGPYGFDNTQASTGTQGQANSACNFAGGRGIANDIWFTWTAPITGEATLTLCGGTTMDSKVAIYAGAGCPTSPAFACNDDGCGVPSTVCFDVDASSVYTIQLGNFPSADGGTGSFTLAVTPPLVTCTYDDGTSDNALGLTNGGALCWMHRFGAPGAIANVSSISTAWGSPAVPGGSPPNGTSAFVALWDDPNDDGDPADAVLLRQIATNVSNANTHTLNTTAVFPPITVEGVYFVGASVVHGPLQFPAPLDLTVCGSLGRAWRAGDSSGTFDFENVAANDVPPEELDSLAIPGVWLLRANCEPSPGTAFCFGDDLDPAVTTDCPCANFGAPGRGCGNSVFPTGAVLSATGTTSPDTVELALDHTPPTTNAIYLQGDAEIAAGVVFGDGVRCAGGMLTRLGLRTANGSGSSTYPSGGQPLSVRGNVSSGNSYAYQAYYRNPNAGWCPPQTFNVSSGIRIAW